MLNAEKYKSTTIVQHQSSVISLITVVIAAMFTFVIIDTFVFSTLWGWYVVPVFGLKPLPLVYAFGIMTMFRFLLPLNRNNDASKNHLTLILARPFVVLFFGWIGTHFI